jgi:hypothetical protein
MGQTNFFKIFSIFAFIAFATVSCWATAESLHLLLSSWPLVLCWVVTIGFFAIASLGTLMIVNSFNQNIYMEKRGLHLLGGILIILTFWLVCIMPTNTHTFFFRNAINDKVSSDIATTQSYLNQIRSNEVTETKINAKLMQLRNAIDSKLGELKAEIDNEANPGNGPKAQKILKDFANLLGIANIEPLSFKGTSIQEREKLNDLYRKKIYTLLENRNLIMVKEMTPSNNNYMKQADVDYKNLELVKKYIDGGTLDLNDADDIKSICDKLNAGYATIKAYPQFVDFKNNNDEATYIAPNPVTKVKRMTSVFDVWEDFLKGDYAGHGFFFWVLISILVDAAAFIFFDIAFKKQQ